jgi:hypothetical protein
VDLRWKFPSLTALRAASDPKVAESAPKSIEAFSDWFRARAGNQQIMVPDEGYMDFGGFAEPAPRPEGSIVRPHCVVLAVDVEQEEAAEAGALLVALASEHIEPLLAGKPDVYVRRVPCVDVHREFETDQWRVKFAIRFGTIEPRGAERVTSAEFRAEYQHTEGAEPPAGLTEALSGLKEHCRPRGEVYALGVGKPVDIYKDVPPAPEVLRAVYGTTEHEG